MPTTDSTRLAKFVADLALDRDRLQAFVSEDREDEMAAAGLTDEERGLLDNPGGRALIDYIWEAGPKPGGEDGVGSGGGYKPPFDPLTV